MKKLTVIVVLLFAALTLYRFSSTLHLPMTYNPNITETVDSIIEKTGRTALDRLNASLTKAGFVDLPKKIIIVGLKEERILQVYGITNERAKLIKEYPFTAFSGILGPKLKQGDEQIPEGVYKIEYLNPNSSYHLSVKVSYPNEFDKKKSKLATVKAMGGDIFIHGEDVTIGCIPIGNKAIEEVFLLTENAFKNEIKVIISPRDFRLNKSYPEIKSIEWENELYDIISKELSLIPIYKTHSD